MLHVFIKHLENCNIPDLVTFQYLEKYPEMPDKLMFGIWNIAIFWTFSGHVRHFSDIPDIFDNDFQTKIKIYFVF